MPFIFKNQDFGKWVYQFFSELEVQKQIKQQWKDGSTSVALSTSEGEYLCEPLHKFNGSRVFIQFSKKELLQSLEYKQDQWYPYPEVTPPKKGAYLVTVRHRGYTQTQIDLYNPCHALWERSNPLDILAFRALPEPYEPEEEK